MQTLSVQIHDDYVNDFISYVNNHSDIITIAKDKNLALDPYFYERKKKLHLIRDDVHNGKMRLLTQEESDCEIESFFKQLETTNENHKT